MFTETTIEQGRISGITGDCGTAFLGIPYAQPPVGPLRFKRPLSPLPWEGTRAADTFGNTAMQRRPAPEEFYGKEFYSDPAWLTPCSEDCLYLNVWTPASSPEERLPVAVWIHGGAFLQGYSHEPEFDGQAFCKRGVILVTLNYRLGAFGFLAHPQLSAEDPDGISGNYGSYDQLAALEWIHRNIAAFGGDPDSITLMGQSAGAISVQTLLSSPLTQGLVSKAVLQSGCRYQSGMNRNTTLAEMEQTGEQFLAWLGCSDIDQVRAISAEELLQKQRAFLLSLDSGFLRFSPCQDGKLLTGTFEEAIETGIFPRIPLLISYTADDISPSVKEGCHRFARKQTELGNDRMWLCQFAHPLPGDDAGAFHSSELWYLFGTLDRSWRPFTAEDRALSERIADAWASFVKDGDPGVAGWTAGDEVFEFL